MKAFLSRIKIQEQRMWRSLSHTFSLEYADSTSAGVPFGEVRRCISERLKGGSVATLAYAGEHQSAMLSMSPCHTTLEVSPVCPQ